jgi:hypothetical protein
MKRRSLFTRIVSLTCGALFVIIFAVTTALGQAGTSSINGTVTDPQGNLVTGATVTLTNEEKNVSRTQQTEGSGAFGFNLIPPGEYRLEVEAPGFKKTVISNVRALVDKPTDVKVALEIGAVTEVVNVTTGAGDVLLNNQDATIGNNFVGQQISQLPLEARNPISLLTLQPGVTRAGNVTGARSDQSNITLDGIDINEAQTNDIGSPVLRLNAEAVEEFRVVVANANATQGRSAGAQISLITKSGTNDFHGALFWAHRNTIFTANTFFNNRAGIARPTLLRNTYGAALGGPIKKDRAFFFYSYEGRRDASGTGVGPRTVPREHLGRGEVRFRGCPPGVVPCTAANATTIALTAAQIQGFYPLLTNPVAPNPTAIAALAAAASRYPANDFNTGDGFNTAGFRFNAPLAVELEAHQLRLDYNLTESGSQQLFFRGTYQNDKQPVSTTSPQMWPDTPQRTRWYHPYGFAAGHTWNISSTKTNSFRFGLTRLALSDLGDTTGNFVNFRFTFDPTLGTYSFNRVNPVHNISDDFSWIHGNHSLQFGTNIRIVRNRRAEFSAAFDSGITNPFFYQSSGNVLLTPITAAGYTVTSNADDLKAALTAVVGRLSQYTARFNFGIDGQPQAEGSPNFREFATEEYDVYAQDIWKISQNLTATFGLRYGLSKPVYETQGFMAAPNIPLGEYLRRRIEAADRGENYTELITVNKVNKFYDWDKNNFQPRVGVAYSPDFGDNWFGNLFGRSGKGVIRGGFAITNDYFGQQLAVTFNSQNTLGFASSQTIPANTYNVTNRPAPPFTGFGQAIRPLQNITVPGALTFPQQRSANFARRIESSLDGSLSSPINYSWNFSYQRDLPGGMVLEAAYIGRSARDLLAGRDAVQPNLNFRDIKSGQTWTQAATILEILRAQNAPIGSIPNVAFFDNVYTPGTLGPILFGLPLTNTQAVYAMMPLGSRNPSCATVGGCYELQNDWTTAQDILDAASGRRIFYQPQYGALAVYSTIASSDYHGGTLSLRQRYKNVLSYDINYTFSKSMDDVSGLQVDAPFTPFVLNAENLKQQRAVSDFDVRHVINANAIWQLPIGRGKWINTENRFANAIFGGWQLTGIFRWNSGLPVEAPLDFGGWPTNWNRRNYTTRITNIQESPHRGGGTVPANLFADPAAAYHSFRSGLPGERGDRNIFRYPGYVTLDMGIFKAWGMPWSEKHQFQFRWEAFNVTNTQRLTSVDGFVQAVDPFVSSATPTGSFGNFTAIQGDRRVMQFVLRYQF